MWFWSLHRFISGTAQTDWNTTIIYWSFFTYAQLKRGKRQYSQCFTPSTSLIFVNTSWILMQNKLKPGKQKSGKVVDCSKCMTESSLKENDSFRDDKQLWGEVHHIVKYSYGKDIMTWALENCLKTAKGKQFVCTLLYSVLVILYTGISAVMDLGLCVEMHRSTDRWWKMLNSNTESLLPKPEQHSLNQKVGYCCSSFSGGHYCTKKLFPVKEHFILWFV